MRFTKHINVKAVAAYGGTSLGEQLSQLKRVTFLIRDEADRMFDMGFEQQISQVLRNLRPDRQVAMFSATFPPHIEGLAKKLLHKPIEVTVGERGKTASKIEQFVEVHNEQKKFNRLLQLLGEWNDHGSIIIFVAKQADV